MRVRVLCALCWLWAGCASLPSRTAPPPSAASAELTEAHALAPDFVARVREAQAELAEEQTSQGRAEQQRRLALLTLAARAEAERIALLRTADAYEQRIARALAQRAEAERAEATLGRQRALQQAAEAARAEAVWALAALARGATGGPLERDRIWELCASRAQALLAAASALGSGGNALDEAELQLTAARTAKLPDRVRKARQALASAYGVLGAARARRQRATEAERRDLLARALELGLGARSEPDAGVLIDSDLRGGRETEGRLELLSDVLPAFPHGGVSVECGGAPRCDGPWLRALRARLGERLRIEPGRGAPQGVVRLRLPEYRDATLAQ